MVDIPSASSNGAAQNSLSDSSAKTASDSSLHSDADSPDFTTRERLSRSTTTEERLKSTQSPLENLLSEVTDLASDACEGLQTLDQEYALSQRGMGALKTLGGLGEAFIGSVGIVAPEPATTIGGAIIFAHGTDVAWSGVQEMWYGRPVETLTDQAVTEGAMLLGADEATAKSLGDDTDLGLSLGSAGVGVYQILTRPVIPQLEPLIVRPQAKPVATAENNASSTAKVATYEGKGAESVNSGIGLNSSELSVRARGTIGDRVFEDINPTLWPGADSSTKTFISDFVEAKPPREGGYPNSNMANAHAEIGVAQQIRNAGIGKDSNVVMEVEGLDVCGFCQKDLVQAAIKDEYSSLTVRSVSNKTGLPKTYYWEPGMNRFKIINSKAE